MTTGGTAALAHPRRGRGRPIGKAFSGRHNSLNALRLALAFTVIASHGYTWAAFGNDRIFGRDTTWGTVAVYGFFAISGFLIAASASRNGLGRYLWQRFLRIFPAYWVCLFVTVLVFGWIGFSQASHPSCGLGCYLTTSGLPFVGKHALFRSFDLHTFSLSNPRIWSIAGTRTIFGAQVQNGSLWSLFYEVLCYLVLGTLAWLGLLRHRRVVLVLTATLWLVEILLMVAGHRPFSVDVQEILVLFPVFLSGSCVYLYRDRVRDSLAMCLGASAILVASPWFSSGGAHVTSGIDVVAPLMVFPLLWLGIHLPLQKVGARNDYSYGFYLYGLPVNQLLAHLGVGRWGGFPFYFVACLAVTAPFAVGSWWLVEKHALKLKKLDVARVLGRRAPIVENGRAPVPMGEAAPELEAEPLSLPR